MHPEKRRELLRVLRIIIQAQEYDNPVKASSSANEAIRLLEALASEVNDHE